jgi:hypothetical protein
MKRTVYDCDGCGKTCITSPSFNLPVRDQIDTADAKTETFSESFDLCVECKAAMFDRYALTIRDRRDTDEGALVASLIRARRKATL